MFRLLNKRAGSKVIFTNASSTSTFILIVGVLIVFYVLFLPNPDQFFNLNSSNSTSSPSVSSQDAILFTAHPGLIRSQSKTDMQFKKIYHLNDVVVKVVTRAEVIKKSNPFVVSSNIFSTHDKTIIFDVPDVSSYKDVLLSFNSLRHKGVLYITLNGYNVASFDLSSPNAEPVDLTDYLQDGKNVLVFHVSKGFFSNFYDISDLKITAYVTDFSKSSASESFVISPDDLRNFDSVYLEYLVKCSGSSSGKLSVSINGFNLSSTVPDCDNIRRLDFPVSDLSSGINYVTFRTTGGSYIIYDIQVVPRIKTVTIPTFYFQLSPKQYDIVKSGGARVVLNMTFGDNSYKEGVVYLNGYPTGFSTSKPRYSMVLDNASLQVYDNSLRIVPRTDLNIAGLVVSFER